MENTGKTQTPFTTNIEVVHEIIHNDHRGKIFCGYQGWFRVGGTGNWKHLYRAVEVQDKNDGCANEFLFIAMFDECDEGTAIYKLVKNPNRLPADYGQPVTRASDTNPDFYLRLTGEATRMFRSEYYNGTDSYYTLPISDYFQLN